jgi:hypothetical protein
MGRSNGIVMRSRWNVVVCRWSGAVCEMSRCESLVDMKQGKGVVCRVVVDGMEVFG